ncbi:MAG: UDP-N-acetylglucosamine--N-acetylmuramyl-(pentapeptide) pyrophosphoryl-undecaprenol N-acetylglucosamine transferase [bacterium]|nr:UDP-N-acetylglucosamine--N-acetylmuramyl-(pentapeptide) pyrophosphoryl-undecaprenol N-acetylglucosamine transferase [bacterium]
MTTGNRKHKIKILLSGGGTGGHVQPALAIGEEVKRLQPDADIRYTGAGTPECDIVSQIFPFVALSAVGMPSIRSFAFLKFAWTVLLGTLKGVLFVLRFKPHALFATGGFASAPAVFATVIVSRLHLLLRKIPIYLFEPNAEPGRMNQLAARMADRIAVVTESALRTMPQPTVVVEGYPVRWEFRAVDRTYALTKLGLPETAKVVLAFGGSMGARTLNEAVVKLWKIMRSDPSLYFIHAVGRRESFDYHAVEETEALAREQGVAEDTRYLRVRSFDDMTIPYSAADIVITRAGAGTLAEICERGCVSIIIPKSNLPGDHQAANAMVLQQESAADVIFERSKITDNHEVLEWVNHEELAAHLRWLLGDAASREKIRSNALRMATPNARRLIATNLIALANRNYTEVIKPNRSSETSTNWKNSPIGLTPSALRARLEKELSFYWSDLLPARVLDLPEKPLPTMEMRDRIEDLSYYTYRGNALLSAGSWETRNEGIKLTALCADRSVLPILYAWIEDRRPVSKLARRLGGDFQTVGFLRRNAVAALPAFNWWDETILHTLESALDDPYWEVRTATAKTMTRLPPDTPPLMRDWMVQSIVKRLPTERNYEVRAAFWLALGEICPALPPAELIHLDLIHRNDLVRTSLMLALERLELRGIGLSDEYADFIHRELLLTSSQFVPNFLLRRAAARFMTAHRESR